MTDKIISFYDWLKLFLKDKTGWFLIVITMLCVIIYIQYTFVKELQADVKAVRDSNIVLQRDYLESYNKGQDDCIGKFSEQVKTFQAIQGILKASNDQTQEQIKEKKKLIKEIDRI